LLIVLSGVSQPFGRELSQSPKPVPQVGTQAEAVQRVVPFALVQGAPHAPQWFVLVASVTSQPLVGLLSQLPKPAWQLCT
jgi:D-alanyl-D-alanine carboxypeptidase